ncbi:MAG: M56 family metallopeptidase, partial [Planctomycetaceae bacterium]
MNPLLDYHALLDEFAGPVGLKLSLALLHFLWQGVLIAAVAAVLMRLFGRRSPQRRYAIGVASLALMAVAPVVTFCLVTPPTLPAVEPAPLADVGDLLVDLEQFDAFLTTLDVPPGEAPVIAPQAVRLTWGERLRLVQPYAVLLWLAGSLLCGLRLVIGAHSSLKCRRGRRALPEPWLDVVVKAAGRIGIKSPNVFVSDRVAEAIAVGLLRPMVLLPAAWIGRVPPDVLEAVLAHELAHLRRYDLWVNLFQRIVESVLFYHPAVWWLSRRVRLEREYCCDETAAAAVTGRAAYA